MLAATLGLAASAPARAAESLEMQVNRAIERGLKVARTYLGPDGAGRTNLHGDYPEGDTALARVRFPGNPHDHRPSAPPRYSIGGGAV